jgi:hypothetical protein
VPVPLDGIRNGASPGREADDDALT